MDPSVTLLEIHKLMYFAQAAGEPLKLSFVKAPYGPYAENLRHVMNQIEGHFLTGYGDAEDRPEKALELLPGAKEEAARFLADHPDTLARFDRVADVISGYETPFGMELLTTVHWVMGQEHVEADELVSRVHGWNARKRMFTADHVAVAAGTLKQKGWIAR
jgi:hypothetical protein